MPSTGRFAVDLPQGWFRIELDPATRERAAAELVDGWVAAHPDLAASRAGLVTMLVATAEHAVTTGAIFAAAAFGQQAGSGPSFAGLVARVMPWPGTIEVADFLDGITAAARGDEAVAAADVVQVGRRRMVRVRQDVPGEGDGDGGAITSFVVPDRESGAFANLEFTSPVAPAPEHSFAHIAATVRLR